MPQSGLIEFGAVVKFVTERALLMTNGRKEWWMPKYAIVNKDAIPPCAMKTIIRFEISKQNYEKFILERIK